MVREYYTKAKPSPGTEAMAHKFAATAKTDGYEGVVVLTCCNGAVDYFTHADGNEVHTLALIEGEWFENVKEVV